MEKFNAVCIRRDGAEKLNIGEVYEVTPDSLVKFTFVGRKVPYKIAICKSYFLRLPSEPKSCGKMTAEELMAVNMVMQFGDGSLIEVMQRGEWGPTSNTHIRRGYPDVYRVKPTNPHASKIAEIEAEMRKLADELNKLK